MEYQAKTFTFPALDGISERTMAEHVSLYQGYVKNFNAISSQLVDYAEDAEKNAHALAELIRRRPFEFGGMRLHEYYFPQLEGGAKAPSSEVFRKQVEKEYHSIDNLIAYLKAIGNMRGPGWAMLYWDAYSQQFLAGFSGEQHQGHFVTLPIVLALDVWEHAYILDNGATGKGKYLDAFFKNLNWSVIEERFEKLSAWKPRQ